MSGACRVGLVALGDSITNGDGEPALGVSYRSWALWLAQALELPYTNLAVDAAVVADLVGEQLPRVRADYDLACLYIGVNDARGPTWEPSRFENDLDAALAHLAARAERVLALHDPTGPRPPARWGEGGGGERSDTALGGRRTERRAPISTTLRGWRLLLPDAVHPTALGQLEIADRAARALAADGFPVPRLPSTLADPRRSAQARLRFGARWAGMLARDLVRRGLEAASRHA